MENVLPDNLRLTGEALVQGVFPYRLLTLGEAARACDACGKSKPNSREQVFYEAAEPNAAKRWFLCVDCARPFANR